MNPGSIGLSYVQINLQKLKICLLKQLRSLFLKCVFLYSILESDLYYYDLPVDQVLSLLVLNKLNYITFYKKWVKFAYSLMSLSVRLDPC